jgi:TetR/AcrR family transcriptional regulator, mexJK operon transcriptional repressor
MTTSNAAFALPLSKRGAARRQAFLAAARQVFEKKGFAEATLDDVIALSGGSRQTLYALFGGKQGLFEAIISDNCETIFQGLTPEKLATLATDQVLKEVGTRYLAIVTSPSCLSLNRLVIAELPRIPEIAQRFWKRGPGRSRAFLAEFFDRQIERGLLRMPDSRAGAAYFLDMLSGTVRLQCLIGLRQPPNRDEIDEMVHGLEGSVLKGGRPQYQALGAADDAPDADGLTGFSFPQAQQRVRTFFARKARELAGHSEPSSERRFAPAARPGCASTTADLSRVSSVSITTATAVTTPIRIICGRSVIVLSGTGVCSN